MGAITIAIGTAPKRVDNMALDNRFRFYNFGHRAVVTVLVCAFVVTGYDVLRMAGEVSAKKKELKAAAQQSQVCKTQQHDALVQRLYICKCLFIWCPYFDTGGRVGGRVTSACRASMEWMAWTSALR